MPPKKDTNQQTFSLDEFLALPAEPKPKPSKNQKRTQKRLAEHEAAISRALFWNGRYAQMPIPPVPHRKTRNRGATKMNIWPIHRLLATGVLCSFCKEPAYVGAIRHKVMGFHSKNIGPVARFPVAQHQSVLAAMYLLRRTFRDYNVIFMIMRMAFEPEVVEQQLIQSEQVHTPCGCRYHRRCYEKLCNKPHRRCNDHNRTI